MSLPKINPGSCCPNSTGSAAGTVTDPENNEHHHDSLYYRKDEAHCQGARRSGRIIGTCPNGVCPDGPTLAGLALAVDPDLEDITLSIVGEEDPGDPPYSAPSVSSVVVVGNAVTVTWGPTNNEGVISLKKIKEAIEANEEATALVEVVVCNCTMFTSFTPDPIKLVSYIEEAPKDGEGYLRKDGVWEMVFTDDIQDVVSDSTDAGDFGKALKTDPDTGLLSILALTVSGTVNANLVESDIGVFDALSSTDANIDDLIVSGSAAIASLSSPSIDVTTLDVFNGALGTAFKHAVISIASATRTAVIPDQSGYFYLTSETDNTVPFADLKIADGEIPLAKLADFPGPFADDAAAAAGGVAINQLYRVTGGTVAWRQV